MAIELAALGPEIPQLNGPLLYPTTGRTANQVTTLNTIGVLSPAVTGTLPAFPDPYGTSGTVAERARAYLSLGEAKEAQNIVREALSKNPGNPELLQLLGVSYAMQKNFSV